jgi:hypothetical protein
MDDDVFAKPGAAASRRVWVWLAGIGVLLLTAWGLAGCFMEGEDELEGVVPWLVVPVILARSWPSRSGADRR